MKQIGLLGGMSWESTAEYYRLINQAVRHRKGGLHSARILMHSVDFAQIEALQRVGRWDIATGCLVEAAISLERGGAGAIIICSNTMHRVSDEIANAVSIPIIHIIDEIAKELNKEKIKKAGFLGTKFTVQDTSYFNRFKEQHDIYLVAPETPDCDLVHRIIYEELCKGVVSSDSKRELQRISKEFTNQGINAVVLGCTELGLALDDESSEAKVFDSTKIHAAAAVEWALEG